MSIKKRKYWLVVLVGSMALNIGFLTVFAMRYFSTPHKVNLRACPMTSDYNHFYTFLGLSDDQLSRIEPLAHGFHSRIDSLSSTILDRRNALILEIEKDTVDRTVIEAIRTDISKAQAELQQVVVEHFLDMKAVMNEEQKQKFFTAMEKNFVNQDFNLIAE